jgi:hypothetical protein
VVVAVLAAGFLATMALTDGRRESRQRVRAEARGLMAMSPQAIERVELEGGGRRFTFVRAASPDWTSEGGGGPLPASLQSHLETSIRFMHVAAPVRVIARSEWERTALEEFGLARPRYAVRLSGGGRVGLAARFGATNPQQILQYASIEGRDELYLMPRFVGQEWERVLESAGGS